MKKHVSIVTKFTIKLISCFVLCVSGAASFAADEKISELTNTLITVGTIERPPFSFYDDKDKLTGFSVELWDAIATNIGLKYN